MRTKDGCIQTLSTWLKNNTKTEGQSIEERALEVYRAAIEEYDRLEDLDRKARAEQARIAEAGRFYAFLHLPSRVEHKVLLADLEAFAQRTGIPHDTLIQLGEGQIPNYEGIWERGKNLKSQGRPWKEPSHLRDAQIIRQQREREAKAQANRDTSRYTMPPTPTTADFRP